MINDREIALLSNQLVFFYCNHCKGLSGSISFPGQLSFSVRNRVLRESFFTRYKMQAIGICRSQSVQSTQLTEIYSQLALCGTSCFPISYVHVEFLPQFTIFVKPKLHKLLPWSLRDLSPCSIKLSILT